MNSEDHFEHGNNEPLSDEYWPLAPGKSGPHPDDPDEHMDLVESAIAAEEERAYWRELVEHEQRKKDAKERSPQ